MPPKKDLEELVTALSDKLDELAADQKKRFDKIDTQFKELRDENTKLKARVKQLEEDNSTLKARVHDLELHSRSTNVRVFNFKPDNDDYNFEELSSQLYNEVFLPVLQGAVSKGRLKEVPSRDRLNVSAHPLQGKDGKPKPIICRLLNGYYRTLLLQCQKEFGKRSRQLGLGLGLSLPFAAATARPPPLLHPFYEDSSSELYRFKQRLAGHDDVSAAWIAGGAVRFKLVNSDVIKKVSNIFLPITDIINS